MTRNRPQIRLDLDRELNREQLVAVTHGEGPQLVLAGAGSGKTRVITYRIAWLIGEGRARPHEIVAVTFTNKAAGEMQERVRGLLGLSDMSAFVGTFHRYALGLLRRYGDRVGLSPDFVIRDSADQLALVKKALGKENLAESAFPPRAVLGRISSAKSRLVNPDDFEAQADNFFQRRIAPVYRRYQWLLREASGIDFDDMIALAVELLTQHEDLGDQLRQRLRYLLVDEFQDTNYAQLRLIEALVGEDGNLTAVGDEDQGIYRWRGAELGNILNFENAFPKAVVHKLERNYRSTQTILDVSGAVIANNQERRGKRLWTDAGAGDPVELYRAADERDEAHWVVNTLRAVTGEYRWADMAVLVRTNAQTRAFEEELLQQRMPYVLVGGVRFYERAEIKDLVAYLRLLRNPADSLSFGRIVNQPPRGIGKTTQELLQQRAQELGQAPWEVLSLDLLDRLPPRGARALRAFRELITELQDRVEELVLPELLRRLLEVTDYASLYRGDESESVSKLENIREFLSAAQEWTEAKGASLTPGEQLTGFLDEVALVTDVDEWETERGISLMTLHSAKGLEFPVVAVAGLEKGLLPHFNAMGEPAEVEEERRLLYVGMTRSRSRLFLTCCRRRRIAGRYQDQEDSPFLEEIPDEYLQVWESPRLLDGPRTRGVHAFFSGSSEGRLEVEPQSSAGVRRGSRVRHPTLGRGVVVELEGEGEETKLTVFFDDTGKRKLIARYAKLELL